jgi:hypothetical protein
MLASEFEVRHLRSIEAGSLVRIPHADSVFWALKAVDLSRPADPGHAVVLLGPHAGRIAAPCLLATRTEDPLALDYGKSFSIDVESLSEAALLSPQEHHRRHGAVVMSADAQVIQVPEIVGFTLMDLHYVELRSGVIVSRPDPHGSVVFPAWSLSRFRAIGNLVVRRDLLSWDGRRTGE